MPNIRPAAVAGLFYPQSPTELHSQLQGYLDEAGPPRQDYQPKALIVPHAGTIYSGKTAAHAYRQLIPWAASITRVVMLGPSHRHPFQGLALPREEFFETPLGRIAVDQTLIAQLPEQDIAVISQAHESEHCLEVQLPFLQLVLQRFEILPLVVGNASVQQVSRVLASVWGGAETLILISTDLSHFHPYQQARQIDEHTNQLILDLEPDLDSQQACGCHPLNGLLQLAAQQAMHIELLDQCNSGDTAGSHERVVGYAAYALH